MVNRFLFLPENIKRLYFSGILGVSLSSLALISMEKGYTVGGSDTGKNEKIHKKLTERGITVSPFHAKENVYGYDALVVSAALPPDSPELSAAKELGIPVFTRGEFLGGVISEYKKRIGVAGTHGKSTVTGMLYSIFSAEGRDVTALIGAESREIGGNLHIGSGDTVLYEACEYKRSFLDFKPNVSAVLNVEREHTDVYPTLSDAVGAYAEFLSDSELCVLNYDDNGCKILNQCAVFKKTCRRLFFSLSDKNADLYAENICSERGFYSFDVILRGEKLFSARLSVAGEYNVKNALAAAGVAVLFGVSPAAIEKGLNAFSGMGRRFEYKGRCNGGAVYDDYAHHPTEIKCMLEAARGLGFKKTICVFQPHTYSRSADLFSEFCRAFKGVEEVIFTDIFAAREENIYGVSGQSLASHTENGKYIGDFDEIAEYIKGKADADTLIITVGAGRQNEIAEKLTIF